MGVSTRTANSWLGKAETHQCPAHFAEMVDRCAEADLDALDEDRPVTSMMRWAVIDEGQHDENLTVCGCKADALREAEMLWSHMTEKEQSRCVRFEVGLVRVGYTGEGRYGSPFGYWTDENGRCDADVYEVAKSWK
jgi:hypothetical protein